MRRLNMKKRYALIPEEREKECPHNWGHYTGSIPCTGRYICGMCGVELDPDIEQEINESTRDSHSSREHQE